MNTNEMFRSSVSNPQTQTAFSRDQIYHELLREATDLFRTRPSWSDYFREILSVDGSIHRRLQTQEEVHAFEQTDQFAEIQRMLGILRQKKRESNPDSKDTKVITVRLPASMHEWLLKEAQNSNTSMNRLCITKLLQVLDDEAAK